MEILISVKKKILSCRKKLTLINRWGGGANRPLWVFGGPTALNFPWIHQRLSKIVVDERSNTLVLNVLRTKISFGGSVKIVGRDVFVSQSVSQSVRVYVCSSIFGNSARTAGPIGTGVAPFDASKRRNYDGACHGSIGGTWHIAHAAA